MQNVMAKAQELAEAILQSDIYQRMKSAEQQATSDLSAMKTVFEYNQLRQKLQDMFADIDNADKAELAATAEQAQLAEKTMNEQPAIQQMQAARKDFDDMMASINSVLRLVINGEADEPGAARCTGSCSTCGGCAAKVQ